MREPPDPSVGWYDRYEWRFYHSRAGWIDGTAEFHQLIRESASHFEKPRVIEIGPGPQGITTRFLRETYGQVDGLDIDPEIRSNPNLNQVFLYDGKRWPLPDQAYDLIVADWVLEHVSDPNIVLREVARVLVPGGTFVFRTPNIFHYVTMISRLTPHWFHILVARRLKGESAEAYPTFYRANTLGQLRHTIKRAGLEEVELRRIEKGPSYARPSRVLYFLFMFYERVVNSTRLLAWARVTILGVARKRAGAKAGA